MCKKIFTIVLKLYLGRYQLHKIYVISNKYTTKVEYINNRFRVFDLAGRQIGSCFINSERLNHFFIY